MKIKKGIIGVSLLSLAAVFSPAAMADGSTVETMPIPTEGAESKIVRGYAYGQISEFYDGPIFHRVRKGETLWDIAEGYYGNMVRMEAEANSEITAGIQAVVEKIGSLNGLEEIQLNHVFYNQVVELPYLTPAICATLEPKADWSKIDAAIVAAKKGKGVQALTPRSDGPAS